VVSVNKYLRKNFTQTPFDGAGGAREREKANDTEADWTKDEQYTKEINTTSASANAVTIYPSNKAKPPIGPVGWVG